MTASSVSATTTKTATLTLSSPSNDIATVMVLNSSTSTNLTLNTMDKIGRFCNPGTTTSSAIICNVLLQEVILKLVENAKAKAYEEGRNEGFNEGYDKGQFLNSGNGLKRENDAFEMLRKEDEKKI